MPKSSPTPAAHTPARTKTRTTLSHGKAVVSLKAL